MELLSFRQGEEVRLGVRTPQGVIDVAAALQHYPTDRPVATDMMAIIRGGEPSLNALRTYIAALPELAAKGEEASACLKSEADLQWESPVTSPQKIICVGLNYRRHAEETGSPIPQTPILFNKFNNALTGHQASIAIPRATSKLDYEAELAIVIGRQARNVGREDALDYVFGYTIANDLSARDLQMRTSQWMLGKISDGFAPLGPWIVTADAVGDPNTLAIQTFVNDELRQNSNTADMIFHCDEIISYLSHHLTLEPGDVLLTGTPEGVVLGYPEDRQVYLQPGDEVKVRIEKLGELHNRFVGEA
ncbi:fumarylacetoacetate hydrolase family protein [Paenibacillus sp. 598K]|uniref:fumarylacetoacetate hydrolase family protein n=1 Tax=Paenibacillus sp. 598K TaxID=1117987 RepID=UPI000FFF314B|nr:fumarylacetoacetate hydrolase family protein [Paenibacillus sp. 598K]